MTGFIIEEAILTITRPPRRHSRCIAFALLSALAFAPNLYAQGDSPQTGSAGNSATGPAGIGLPASFAGTTPCADCTGIKQALTLRSDGLYLLQRQYLGKRHGASLEHGLWTVDADGKHLTLHNGNTVSQQMLVTDKGNLRILNQSGAPSAMIDLHRMSQVDTTAQPMHWQGTFQHTAATATFTDCASGLSWPVSRYGAYLKAQHTYLHSHQPLLIDFSGRLAVSHTRKHTAQELIVIGKLHSAKPGAVCGNMPSAKTAVAPAKPAAGKSEIATASLKNTEWKLIELNGNEIDMPSTQIQGIRIKFADDGSSVKGFGGCNQINGNYKQEVGALHFSRIPNTLRACESPLMDVKSQVLQKILNATTAYRIEDQHLILSSGDHEFAQFEAVDLP